MFWIIILILLAIIFSLQFSWMGAVPFIIMLMLTLLSPMLIGILMYIAAVFIIAALLISMPLMPGCFVLLIIMIFCGMLMTLF